MTGPLTADQFAAACELLWGRRWKEAAARALGISRQQVHRMAKGESGIRRRHRIKLAEAMERKVTLGQAMLPYIAVERSL